MKTITVYKVETWDRQIMTYREPEKVSVQFDAKSIEELNKNGFIWDKYANYYKTMKRAKAAINWALSN